MTTITKKRVISLFLVLGILMPYLTGLFSHVDLTAKEAPLRTSETILDSKDAKVDVAHTVFQNEIQWEIAYEKKASSAQQPRRLKLAIDEIGHGLGTVRDLNRADDEDADADGWYVMNDTYTSDEEKDVLTFSTTIKGYVEGSHFIKVAVQIDEEATQVLEVNTDGNAEQLAGEVAVAAEEIAVVANEIAPEAAVSHNENILMDHDAGPHTVHANSSAVESVKPEAEAVEVKPEAEAGVVAGDGGDEIGAVEDAAGNIVTLSGGLSYDTGSDNGKSYKNRIPNYEQDFTGVYPADGNSWVPDRNTTVINHSGGDNTSTEWNHHKFINYVAEGSTRTDYDFGISKWAQEATSTGGNVVNGLHDIYLEVFGNTIDHTVATPVNLVFIADRSGSMDNGTEDTKSRWYELGEGIKGFMDDIDTKDLEDAIHIGYTDFNSDTVNSVEIDRIDMQIGETEADTVQNTIISNLSTDPGGATRTHAGLNSASELFATKALNDPDRNARNVVILLTDGVPTYSYQITKAEEVLIGVLPDKIRALEYDTGKRKGEGSYAGLKNEGSGASSQYKATLIKEGEETEDTVTITNNFIGVISEAEKMKKSGIEIRVIGIQLKDEVFEHNSDRGKYTLFTITEIEKRMQAIASPRPELGPNGEPTYFYKNVGEAKDIVAELSSIFGDISNTVVNGTINDPVSNQLIFQNPTGKISVTQVDVNGNLVAEDSKIVIAEGKMPEAVYDTNTNTVSVTNINLGKDQRVRIKYQTRINTETADFVPDSWYPVNRGETTLRGVATQAGEATFIPTNGGSKVNFAIPSVSAVGVDLQIKKLWENDSVETRPDNLDFTVSRIGGIDGTISGPVSLSKVDFGSSNTWTKTINTIEAASATYSMPKFNKQGTDFTYAIEENVPNDYILKSEEINGKIYSFVNEIKFKPIGINVLKVSSEGETPLSGAEFTLTGKFNDNSTSHNLTDNKNGSYSLPAGVGLLKSNDYTLTETTPPTGHSVMEGTVKITVNDKGEVTWGGKATELVNNIVHGTIENKYIAPQVKIRKYTGDLDKHYLGGAKFGLYIKGESTPTKTEDSAPVTGLATFTNLSPGDYVIKEIAGLVGYDTRDNAYSFKVTDYGQVEYLSGIKEEGDDLIFLHQNKLKDFDLTIKKIDDLGNELKGASFKLEGPDKYLQEFEEHDSATFTFDELNVGTYTLTETKAPKGYILAAPITIVIDELGKVTVNDESNIATVVHNSGTDVNTISFKVDNKPKNPLPQTGGIGTAIFYLVGAIAIAGVLVNVQLKKRKGAN